MQDLNILRKCHGTMADISAKCVQKDAKKIREYKVEL